jgi:hypothetical protein
MGAGNFCRAYVEKINRIEMLKQKIAIELFIVEFI